jgi:hypothetical protein
MSHYRCSFHMSPPGGGAGFGSRANGRSSCGRWAPFEVVAMILGFIFFWPIGLAIVLWKIWQRKHDYEGDIVDFGRERFANLCGLWESAGAGGGARSAGAGWRGPGFMHSSGNSAFDDWRESELARLEEERRKLAEAQREFAEHIEQLRRAKDREEFESFMRARKGGSNGSQPSA